LIFVPEFFKVVVVNAPDSKLQQFPEYLESFPENFGITIFHHFEIFGVFD